jgi:hypothetical protein
MKRERRQPTRVEWERITTRRPVVRKIPAKRKEADGGRTQTETRQAAGYGRRRARHGRRAIPAHPGPGRSDVRALRERAKRWR